MTSNPRTSLNRMTIVWASAALAMLVAPQGAAAPVADVDAAHEAAVPVPAALEELSEGLLGFGTNPTVDVCNTQPISTGSVTGFETWYGAAQGGKWIEAEHNGERIPVETLERAIFEHRGEEWVDRVFDVMYECAASGGFCACASLIIEFFSGKAVACLACCPDNSMPFCVCYGLYAYGSCGCYR